MSTCRGLQTQYEGLIPSSVVNNVTMVMMTTGVIGRIFSTWWQIMINSFLLKFQRLGLWLENTIILIDCLDWLYGVLRCCQQYFSHIAMACPPIHVFLKFFLTNSLHNIISKPLVAFWHNNSWKNWKLWERNESCSNDYHYSLGKNIGAVRDWTSNLSFLSPVCYRLICGAQQMLW